jgi:hypothetical protein
MRLAYCCYAALSSAPSPVDLQGIMRFIEWVLTSESLPLTNLTPSCGVPSGIGSDVGGSSDPTVGLTPAQVDEFDRLHAREEEHERQSEDDTADQVHTLQARFLALNQ